MGHIKTRHNLGHSKSINREARNIIRRKNQSIIKYQRF
jgi:hypothetical protein